MEISRIVTLPAVLQSDGLIADAGALRARQAVGIAAAQSLAPNEAGAADGDILKTFAIDQTVGPVIMPEVLISLPGLRRPGRVVAACCGSGIRHFCCKDGRAVLKIQADMALEPDGIAGVSARGKPDRAATLAAAASIARLTEGVSMRRAIAAGAEIAHVDPARRRLACRSVRRLPLRFLRCQTSGKCDGQASNCILKKVSADQGASPMLLGSVRF